LQQRVTLQAFIGRAHADQERLDLLGRVRGPQIRASHAVTGLRGPRLVAMAVPDKLGDAKRPARIPRGRLDPQPLEGALAKHPTVPDAVESYSAGQAEILEAGLAVRGSCHPQHD